MAIAAEDRLLSKILGVTLQYQAGAEDELLFLAELAQVAFCASCSQS